MRYLIFALMLSACGLVDDLDQALDDSPPEDVIYIVKMCALTEEQAADTANYQRCDGDPRPPKPPQLDTVAGVIFSDGGQ